jgi:hypothetical protein
MKKTILPLLVLVFLPLAAFGQVKARNVASVSVKGEELIIIAKKKLYFWAGCSSVGLEAASGFDTISVGDTIKYKGFKIPVGVIRYVEHEEETTSEKVKPATGYLDIVFSSYSNDADMNLKLLPHNTDCIIAADEAHLPDGGTCDNTWILVEGCSVLKEEK